MKILSSLYRAAFGIKYQIKKAGNKQYIERDDGDMVSHTWDKIYTEGLCLNQSLFYRVENDNKQAIFHLHNKYSPISRWWDEIYTEGIIEGTSDFYVVRDNDKEAVFYKKNKIFSINGWHDKVYREAVIRGYNDWFIFRDNNRDYMCNIFDFIDCDVNNLKRTAPGLFESVSNLIKMIHIAWRGDINSNQ